MSEEAETAMKATGKHPRGAEEFFRGMKTYSVRATQHSPDDAVARDRGVRLYRSTPDNISLQIRCPVTLANLRDGKNFSIATASLLLEDAKAIRDALSDLIDSLESSGEGI